jgi:hypothetical protein
LHQLAEVRFEEEKSIQFDFENHEESQETEDAEYLAQIRRRFQTVAISGGIHVYSSENRMRPSVLEFLKKHGTDILKIKLNNLTFHKGNFLKFIKALPNVRDLELNEIHSFSTETDPDEDFKDFELKHLTKLDISSSIYLEVLATVVTSTLKTLKYNSLWNQRWTAELLGKQKGLEELSLQHCLIKDVKVDPENCHIEKLDIGLDFLNESAFKMFSELMKIQKSVNELKLFIEHEELMNNNYTENFTHLLSLKSLKKFTFDSDFDDRVIEDFSRLKVCNLAVDTLILINPSERSDLTSLSKFFPNVTDLEITWIDFYDYQHYPVFLELEPINSMKKIRKIEMNYMVEFALADLDLKELREFYAKEKLTMDYALNEGDYPYFCSENWRRFTNNNSQLEVLHMLPKCRLSVEQLVITLETLPLLKSLELTVYGCDFVGFNDEDPEIPAEEYKKVEAEKAAKLIGENYDRLQHLKLDFDDADIRTCVLYYLEEHYPGLKLNK